MRKLWTPLTLAAILWAWGTQALAPQHSDSRAPKAPPRTYVNPVWVRDFPDPFILRVGGRFYAYATATAGYDLQVMESGDLVHWTHRGSAFRPPWARWDYWAPEAAAYRGKVYLIYSARNPRTNKHCIAAAVAGGPLGPFRHHAFLVDTGPNAIDGTVFTDRGGAPYLVYCEEDPRRIVIRQILPGFAGTGLPVTELVHPDRGWERGITEAPTLILRNGVYHLFYSVGWFQSSKRDACYAVCHARSRSLTGPYVKDPEPILKTVPGKVYGPGHQCVVTVPGGEMWMAYHGWDDQGEPRYGANPLGRTLRIDRVVWHGDVPTVVGPTTDAQPAPRIVK